MRMTKVLILGFNQPVGRNELDTADVVLKATGPGRSSYEVLKDDSHTHREGYRITAEKIYFVYL